MFLIIKFLIVKIYNFEGRTCPSGSGVIEIADNYADDNGTWWFFCETTSDSVLISPSLAITSYMNTLHITQKSLAVGAKMNATIKVKKGS